MPPSAEEARRLLCALGEHVRDLVVASRGMDMAAVAGETVADTIYAIDGVADDALLRLVRGALARRPGRLRGSRRAGARRRMPPAWTVIVDTIDGTRGLMYDKRPAWCLAAAAPPGGGLADIVAAAMTELPTAKQGAADQLSATRGGGLRGRALSTSAGGTTAPLQRAAVGGDGPRAQLQRAGEVLPARQAGPGLAGGRAVRTGSGVRHVFDDEYLSSGRPASRAHHRPGPLRGRPAAAGHTRTVSPAIPTTSARPCLLEEVGGVVTDPWGDPLDGPAGQRVPGGVGRLRQRGAGERGSARCWRNWWTVWVRGRAPGRLDLLGGVADYSGALVLEMPTRQGDRGRRCIPDRPLVVGPVTLSPAELEHLAGLADEAVRRELAAYPRWTHYVIGVAAGAGAPRGDRIRPRCGSRSRRICRRPVGSRFERGARGGDGPGPRRRGPRSAPPGGAVPGGGEPCGRVHRAGSWIRWRWCSGRPGAVLPILCRPASVGDPLVRCRRDLEIVGLADRSRPRCRRRAVRPGPGRRPSWASAWWKTAAGRAWSWVSELPERRRRRHCRKMLEGRAFLRRWGASGDDVTTVRPDETYPVRAATLFGVRGACTRRGGLGGIGRRRAGATRPTDGRPARAGTTPWAWAIGRRR